MRSRFLEIFVGLEKYFGCGCCVSDASLSSLLLRKVKFLVPGACEGLFPLAYVYALYVW